MAGGIGTDNLAKKYIPLLDEVYKYGSKTSILDAANNQVQFVNADTVKIFKSTANGLGDYNRSNGYAQGAYTGTWETFKLEIDRGRKFDVDSMDQEETINMLLPSMMSAFMREGVVPEIDAYRMAKYAGKAGTVATAALTSSTTLAAIDTAETAMDDAEVPEDGRILFVVPQVYAYLKGGITRTVENGEGNIQREVEYFDNMRVVKVPQNRMYTAIDLLDGTSEDELAGGYAKASTGKDINFMIIHPSAVAQVVKHNPSKLIPPDLNPDADAYRYKYRLYHDAFVMDNKVKGIYLHKAS